jgi:hypothetical protein
VQVRLPLLLQLLLIACLKLHDLAVCIILDLLSGGLVLLLLAATLNAQLWAQESCDSRLQRADGERLRKLDGWPVSEQRFKSGTVCI